MNRIYQGRVTKVEVLNGNGGWNLLGNWQTALWQHHDLFQDAINYYTLALAAMASGCADVAFQEEWITAATTQAKNDPKVKEKDRANNIREARDLATAQLKALTGWRTQVAGTWVTASRKAEKFNGPQARLASVLKLASNDADFEKAADSVLRSSQATAAQHTAALLQLLSDKGDLNQVCVARLPWLATAAGKFAATSKATASSQELKRQQAVRQLQQISEQQALDQAPCLDLGLFLTQPAKEFLKGADAGQMLRDYFAKTEKKFPEIKSIAEPFDRFVTGLSDAFQIPSPGRRPSGLYPIAALFKFFPRIESLAAFRKATKTLAEAKDKEVVSDAVAESRVADQPHFDYFTNLALVSGGGDDERDTRAVWFEFDLAAFIEAIKAPRRYFEDTVKREAVADRLREKITAMEGKGHESSGADGEDESLPGFEDDKRIELLKKIVQKNLAWLAEAEGEASASGPREYTISERTVRGFGEIKRRWLAAVESGQVTEKRLLDIIAKEQTEHRDDFGSATLYRELAKPEFQPIWRDGGTQPWHAEDPLSAWLDYKELQSELQDKERPIRFTPAHPKCSPRFFIFPKKSEAQPKTPKRRSPKAGLLSRHEPGRLSFSAGVVLPTDRGLAPTVVRIHYAAPRLCRDQVRFGGDNNLYETPWLQPMMAALGLGESPDRVNFANCRITLQPAGESNIQLTFPVEVSTEKVRAAVTRGAVWERQFNLHPDGENFYNASLRWPHEKQPAKAPVPWHEQVNSFRCVATDLGQRDAGAFARLLVLGDGDPDKRPSRSIGANGNKQWRAAVERTGLFRLPGEDAQVWREISERDKLNPDDSGKPFDFREELWGERGRPARDWEADDTEELMRMLEAVEKDADGNERLTLLPENWRNDLSFPEQNGKLLIAMRRYQSRIARLHRWCWFLKGDEKQQGTAWKEIGEYEDARLVTPELKALAGKSDPRVIGVLESQLRYRLELAPRLLIRIANRILPLRGRSWLWEKHPAATEENSLHHLTQNGASLDSKEKPVWLRGQRGLSMERIEQIEELRKRCQSLNQTLRREVGGKPPIRRDESVPDPCPDLLEKLDNLKKQRINQTAHMILAEALGLRLAPPSADKKRLRKERDQHGIYEKILDKNGRWVGPVDFIVIEDLSRYRASQGRAPRENSRLMKWCHRAVRDKLKQLCEVFGLPVLEMPAAYSSRFCSRSGVPGFRAEEVTAGFTKTGQWAWLAGKKDDQGRLTAEAQRLLDLDRRLAEAQTELERQWTGKNCPCPKRTLLVPISGGPVFVPVADRAQKVELQPAIVQADINAAINLGLRAIADPRLWTIHPRLRTGRLGADKLTKSKKGKPDQESFTSPVETRLITREKRKFGETGVPLLIHRPTDAKMDDTRQPNFFADFAGLKSIAETLANKNPHEFFWLTKEWTWAEISGGNNVPPLIHSKSVWGCVKAAQWDRVSTINETRLAAWCKKYLKS